MMELTLKNISDILKVIADQGFYGELVIRFENGKPVVVKKTETIKL